MYSLSDEGRLCSGLAGLASGLPEPVRLFEEVSLYGPEQHEGLARMPVRHGWLSSLIIPTLFLIQEAEGYPPYSRASVPLIPPPSLVQVPEDGLPRLSLLAKEQGALLIGPLIPLSCTGSGVSL